MSNNIRDGGLGFTSGSRTREERAGQMSRSRAALYKGSKQLSSAAVEVKYKVLDRASSATGSGGN